MADFESIDVIVEPGSSFRLNTGGHSVNIVPTEGPILTPPDVDWLSRKTLADVIERVNALDPESGPARLALASDTIDLDAYQELFDAASAHGVQLELHITSKRS